MPAPATPIAQTSKRRVSWKKETTFNTAAGASSATVARRTQLNLNLTKQAIESGEKRSDFQRADVRHGSRMVDGNLDGELINGVWEEFFAALVRRDFATVTPISFSTGDGITSSGLVFTRAAGGGESFITGGIRVGQIVRWTGLSATGTNSRNFLVTAVTATAVTLAVLDGGAAPVDIVSADESCTLTVAGQTSFVPASAHTSDSFTIEDYLADADLAKIYTGCRIVGLSLRMQPNGMVTVSWRIMGIDQTIFETSSAPYFTSPTEPGVGGTLEASLGYVRLNGAQIAVVTGVNLDIDLGASSTPVVGSNVSPDIFFGKAFVAKGQLSAYITDHTYLTAFRDETEMELFLMFQYPGSQPRACMGIFMPRVKLMSAGTDDPDTVITQTLDFEALLKGAATGYEPTTLMIQDSTLS